jgi:hypothetical protein
MFSDFSVSSLLAGFIFSVIGFWMFKEGKRRLNYPILFVGVALMIYPYFVSGHWLPWIVGIALCGVAKYYWV